jgi:hypothetical protein
VDCRVSFHSPVLPGKFKTFCRDHLHPISKGGAPGRYPLGPALFSLIIHPILQRIQEELAPEYHARYLDDATVGDTPDKTLAALTIVREMAEKAGFSLNYDKCEVAILGATPEEEVADLARFQVAATGIIKIAANKAILLGGPMTELAIHTVLSDETDKLGTLAARLTGLTAHSAFYLLRASISLPRLIYFLRVAPCFRRRKDLNAYDAKLKEVLQTTLKSQLTPSAWAQSGP